MDWPQTDDDCFRKRNPEARKPFYDAVREAKALLTRALGHGALLLLYLK